jgi:hypothetical protein
LTDDDWDRPADWEARAEWGAHLARAYWKYGLSETAKQQQVEIARRFVRSRLENSIPSTKEHRQFIRDQLKIEKIEVVLAAARRGDRDAMEILRERARVSSENLSVDFYAFVLECFIDGPPKASPGVKSKDAFFRDQIIAMFVKFVSVTYGFPIYRNPEHRGEESGPVTACKIIGDELGLSEDRVQKIWEADRRAGITCPPEKRFAAMIQGS